jgi:predicted TIM-barrel fold metal-dependent hydrolase
MNAKIVDGHSHLFQVSMPVGSLKRNVNEIDGFDVDLLLRELDRLRVAQIQTMPQEETRIAGRWAGSNDLAVDLQRCAPERIIAYAAAEPLDTEDVFNRARLREVRRGIEEQGLKGLLLTPPYGHYYSNDRRVYPFYEMAVELDVPIYFHHSHMFGPPRNCPLKYARIWLLDDLTIDFPELRFSVEHMGYPWTEKLLAMMARAPNVYTDIAMYIEPVKWYEPSISDFVTSKGRHLTLARNLGMAREYGVLDRVFYGSDCLGDNVDDYIDLLSRETAYIREELGADMERLGYPALAQEETEGLLCENVLRLWGQV